MPQEPARLPHPRIQAVREIAYRVLLGEQGGSLRALASRDDHFSRIARVVKYIHAEHANQLSVEGLARRAAMSVPAFHHHFKLVTASSPLQYLKRIRLDRAKRLMAHDGYNASMAALAVGYESPSQFSREFKRLFGVTPGEEAEQTRRPPRGRLIPARTCSTGSESRPSFVQDDPRTGQPRRARLTSFLAAIQSFGLGQLSHAKNNPRLPDLRFHCRDRRSSPAAGKLSIRLPGSPTPVLRQADVHTLCATIGRSLQNAVKMHGGWHRVPHETDRAGCCPTRSWT